MCSLLARQVNPWRCTLLLILCMTALHIIAAFSYLNLPSDSAHYALYAEHLSLSYFDHPPLVGWLQAIALLFGRSNALMQLMPILLSVVWPLLLYYLARVLWPQQSAWLAFTAVVISQLEWITFSFTILFTPQLPLLCCCLASFIVFYKAVLSDQWRYWIATGVFLGIAALSDYNAIFLGVLIFLVIFIEGVSLSAKQRPRHMPELPYAMGDSKGGEPRFFPLSCRHAGLPGVVYSAKFWVMVLLSIVIASPVFIWNSQHHWASFHYQLHHGVSTGHWKLPYFLAFQAIQCVAYNPVIYVLSYSLLLTRFKQLVADRSSRFLLCFMLPMLVLYGICGGFHVGLPHWVSVAWVCMALLLAKYGYTQRVGWLRKTAVITCVFSIILMLLVTSLMINNWWPGVYSDNPFYDFSGWAQAGRVARVLSQTHQEAPLFVTKWHFASRLAWYSQLPVQVTNDSPNNMQFNLWFGKPKQGVSGIVVVLARFSEQNKQQHIPYFKSCSLLQTLDTYEHHRLMNVFHYYWCHDYLGENQ